MKHQQSPTGTCSPGALPAVEGEPQKLHFVENISAKTAQSSADRSGDSLTGSGTATISFTGGCAPFVNVVEAIQISGQRLSLSQGPPDSSSTIVQTFVPFAALIGAGQ